jgi:hypothetical protein
MAFAINEFDRVGLIIDEQQFAPAFDAGRQGKACFFADQITVDR